jgi:hypothetical protein
MTKSTITASHGAIVLRSATYSNPVTVASGATVYGAGATIGLAAVVYWTIKNYGVIGSVQGDGVSLAAGGVVENEGVITGGTAAANAPLAAGVYIKGSAAGTVENAGGISGEFGVKLESATGWVSNASGGVIAGGTAAGEYAVFSAHTATVENAGSISGRAGVSLYGGLVSNAAGAAITGVRYGVEVGTGGGTVDNAGSISGSVFGVSAYGLVSNAAGGEITSGFVGVAIGGATGTLYNAGTISAYRGVSLDSAASGLVVNTGTITGSGKYNEGVYISGYAGTVENAGAIDGGKYAVYFQYAGSNSLIVDAGASFTGEVLAAGSGNTIELTSSASAGTLAGLGSEYVGFQTVTIDPGAAWEVTGTEAGMEAASFSGFNPNDLLYITNLSYAPGATATLSGGTLAVVSGGTTIDIAMTNVTGTNFYAHNVGGEVLVNESTIACYCRGTLVKTDRGPVAVEDLAVGDLLVTLSGELRPLKWIGRRSYAGWLAAGNPDVQPVLFKAGALADNVPSRDLMVSPEHAMYLDGALIPARHLVNGVSIIQTSGLEEIHYFHLELEEHAVIFAEDAASETYVDDGNRFMFHNVFDYYAEFPDAPRGRDARYCAPRIEDGFELEAARRALSARAALLRPDGTAAPAPELRGRLERVTRTLVEGWALGSDPLVILDNGAVIGRVTPGRDYRFRFSMPTGFWAEVRHAIEVRREADWTLLQGSGKVSGTGGARGVGRISEA